MNLREEIVKALDRVSDDALEGVLDYIKLVQEPESVEPTEEERQAMARGKGEMARDEVVRWRDIKTSVL